MDTYCTQPAGCFARREWSCRVDEVDVRIRWKGRAGNLQTGTRRASPARLSVPQRSTGGHAAPPAPQSAWSNRRSSHFLPWRQASGSRPPAQRQPPTARGQLEANLFNAAVRHSPAPWGRHRRLSTWRLALARSWPSCLPGSCRPSPLHGGQSAFSRGCAECAWYVDAFSRAVGSRLLTASSRCRHTSR